MVITYQGENYFKFQAGTLTLLLDPTNGRSFRGANIVLNTLRPSFIEEPKESNEDASPFWTDHQGEYEVGGIEIQGISAESTSALEKTVYRFVMDGITVVVLGHISEELSPRVQEVASGADILIVPGGKKPYLGAPQVAKLVRQAAPGIVIVSLFGGDPKSFLKEFGKQKYEIQEKFVIKKKDIKPGAMEVVCLKA